MLSLLQRRRQMMQQLYGGGEQPLYQLKQGILDTGSASRAITVSGSSVTDKRTGGGTGTRPRYVSGTACSTTTQSAAWFHLHAGDDLVLKMKNISYTLTSGTQHLYELFLYAGSTKLISRRLSNSGPGTGTLADAEEAVTLTADATVTCFQLWAGNAQTVNFDAELWVNGTRYI